ncbi:DUF4190 domain-containing protein [Actinoplanes regularis]|uniref:DUF4190 domain-containing protein n=1 Tax=Actinoplanes regularis TaxID=52697 RepID=A0A239BTM3_9ACTN|nr:DUF4190 domain-containing protein [Actinoplanes regularis]GIE88313.1 hypothetical protein Are01nite_47930 [Actinoplanes regularis]SNS10781.1 protein of unknown function [Actinoplanes regularis]
MTYDPRYDPSTPSQGYQFPPAPQAPVSPMPQYGGFVPVLPPPPTSNSAVVALVVSLVGLFAGWCLLGIPNIVAVIAGHVALKETRDNRASGRGMAVAGLAIGYVSLAPAIILFFWLVLGGMASVGGVDPTPTPTR